jgi:hypothetical protein
MDPLARNQMRIAATQSGSGTAAASSTPPTFEDKTAFGFL